MVEELRAPGPMGGRVTGHDLVEGSTINLSFEGPRMQLSAGCNIISTASDVTDVTIELASS